ncbi:MAG TPA: hypothetical protein VGN27_11185 [Gaiellaceae bacterium]|nr:hypothetical protein [Gaiellaceae bacterium]
MPWPPALRVVGWTPVIREELKRLGTWEERHRRLVSRLILVLVLTAVVDVIGTALVYAFERSAKQTEIHSLFDAFFFTTVQLLTVSSQIKNPLTVTGRIVDVFLEVWAVIVVAGSARAIRASSRPATRSNVAGKRAGVRARARRGSG